MMIKKSYNDFDTFMQDIIDVYLENEGFSVLCDYKLACKIIKKFLSFDNKTKINSISLDPPEWNGYGGEFVVSTFENELFCERARRDDKPILLVMRVLFSFSEILSARILLKKIMFQSFILVLQLTNNL